LKQAIGLSNATPANNPKFLSKAGKVERSENGHRTRWISLVQR